MQIDMPIENRWVRASVSVASGGRVCVSVHINISSQTTTMLFSLYFSLSLRMCVCVADSWLWMKKKTALTDRRNPLKTI